MTILPEKRGARIRLIVLMFLLLGLCLWGRGWTAAGLVRYRPVEGDIIFQSLPSGRGIDLVDAIEGATECPFSHCGVVVRKEGKWEVLEAMVPTVQEVSLTSWINRDRGRFAVYRLEDESAKKKVPIWIESMRQRMGIAYDYRYQMSDAQIYCSELPFDAWLEVTGESMGEIVTLGDLKWEPYRSVIEEAEDSTEIPVDREMITPRDLAKASQLQLVVENGISVNDQP